MNSKKMLMLLFVIFAVQLNAQQENVPLDNNVYTFLKEMNLKGVIKQIHDDSPNLSRDEVRILLEEVSASKNQLSITESKLLQKYKDEFYDNDADSTNTFQFFGSGFSNNYSDFFSNKIKHTYAYRKEKVNLYLETIGRFLYGQGIKPGVNNSELFDIGLRVHGTLFNGLGYSMTMQKGGVSGSQELAPTFDPRLNYNFKFVERLENIGNYDFTEGYLRYHTEPIEDMNLSFQIGREKIKLGYGYGSKLVLSGDHPYLDMIRTDFSYGILSFTSIAASTVGTFSFIRDDNYTKYLAYNKFKFSFDNFADFGIGEVVVYSGRGLDFAYLNPFAFYKYEEMSLQDRDNGVVFLDFQTRLIKNLELQGTFYLDENILSHLQEMNLFSNKTAYQLGAFWYSPFSINDLSLIFEYTKIRPYVYSHTNEKNSYTAWAQNLGHRIGPNADEIFVKASYNFNEWIRGNIEYQQVRSAENIYDGLGNLIFNSGGDYMVPWREGIDAKYIDFLEGERINQNIFAVSFRIEPVREIYFDLLYKFVSQKNLTNKISENSSFAYLQMMFEF